MNIGVDELNILLNQYWVVKEENPDLYYQVKNKLDTFKNFVQEKLGCHLIVTPRMIKLEKIPVYPKTYMGLGEFKTTTDYVLLMLVLIYLEDKIVDEQFILSDLIENIHSSSVTLALKTPIDWNRYTDRKSLVTVLNALKELHIIRVCEERGKNFADEQATEALYENTGLANFLMHDFHDSIFQYDTIQDFIHSAWENQEEEKGDIRRYKVYRSLLFMPAFYMSEASDSETDYLRKLKSGIADDMEKYVGASLDVNRSMACILFEPNHNPKYNFPNSKAITDVVLLIHEKLIDQVEQGILTIESNEWIECPKIQFYQLAKEVRDQFQPYFSKNLRELLLDGFVDVVKEHMAEYDLIKEADDKYYFSPMVGKIKGRLIVNDENEQLRLEVLE